MKETELLITKSSLKLSWQGRELIYQVNKTDEDVTLTTEDGNIFIFSYSYPIYKKSGDIDNLRVTLNGSELKLLDLKQSDDFLSLIIKQ